jgi:hypothetical protein
VSGLDTIAAVSLVLGAAWIWWAIGTCEPPKKDSRLDPAVGARLISAINRLLDGRIEEALVIYGPDLAEHTLTHFKARYAAGEMSLDRFEQCVDQVLVALEMPERDLVLDRQGPVAT